MHLIHKCMDLSEQPGCYAAEGAEPEAGCVMPLAIIVDDRLDVRPPASVQMQNDSTCLANHLS